MLRQLVWINTDDFQGFGCSACPWRFKPSGAVVGESLEEMKLLYEAERNKEFATHVCTTVPHWILQCVNCKTEFQHSQIDDVPMSYLDLPPKPNVPPSGVQCVCAKCGVKASYRRTDLKYRA